jgi:hypothetical protein
MAHIDTGYITNNMAHMDTGYITNNKRDLSIQKGNSATPKKDAEV